MREDLAIVRSDTPSRVLAEVARKLSERQTSMQKQASESTDEPAPIRLADAARQGFRKVAFDIYENPDYGTLWKLETIDDEPWLVVYTDEDDTIIRKVACRLMEKSGQFTAEYKTGDTLIFGKGLQDWGEVKNIRHTRSGPEYLVLTADGAEVWVHEGDITPPEQDQMRQPRPYGSVGDRIIAAVIDRVKIAQNPPMSPSEEVSPMAFNVREDTRDLSEPEIKQYFEEQEDKREKEPEDEVKVTTEPSGAGGREETLEMTFPDRVKHIKIDLEGEEGEEEEEIPETATPPTGTPTLPEGAPGPGLSGEVPVTF